MPAIVGIRKWTPQDYITKFLHQNCQGKYPLVYRYSRLYSCNEYLIWRGNKGLSCAILLLVIHSHQNHAIPDDGVVWGHFSVPIRLAGTSKGTVGMTNLCRVSHPCLFYIALFYLFHTYTMLHGGSHTLTRCHSKIWRPRHDESKEASK